MAGSLLGRPRLPDTLVRMGIERHIAITFRLITIRYTGHAGDLVESVGEAVAGEIEPGIAELVEQRRLTARAAAMRIPRRISAHTLRRLPAAARSSGTTVVAGVLPVRGERHDS
ncbi:hypothetical protein M3E71_04410 [Brevibacterium casei]|uniref:hypothetical protein n=2 Tax=Brevibacterium casei TaxID=33889 RepID=UPI00223BA8E3|nr:hypothetical protein [Brevibacterium casei]MCT1559623.1 hypothetical protein [Brevibacterium casei]